MQVRKEKYEQSNPEEACKAGETATERTPSFRFNPGIEKKCFPDGVSYLKHAGENRRQREETEKKCQKLEQKNLIKRHGDRIIGLCDIDGTLQPIRTINWGTKEVANKMFGYRYYWLRNSIYEHLKEYLPGTYIEWKDIDLSHNTNTKRLKLKSNFKRFHYVGINADGKDFCVIIAEHKNSNFYVYDIEKKKSSQ